MRTLAEELTEAERKDPRKAPRVSATDPEASRMKMSDGGFRPASNVQFDTTADGQGTVLGVSVSARGNDDGEMTPMQEQVEQRSGRRPDQKPVDGATCRMTTSGDVEQSGTQVFAPVPRRSAAPGGVRDSQRTAEDRAFHERIQSAEGKAVYHQRGEVAELTNAHAKSRHGLGLLLLRGVKGALTLALLAAFTKDVQVLVRARAARAQGAQIKAVARAA